MEEQEWSKDTETSVLHVESDNCQCPECDNLRKRLGLKCYHDAFLFLNQVNCLPAFEKIVALISV